MRRSPPNAKCPSSSAPWWFSAITGLPLWLGSQGACSVGSVSGCFACCNVFTRPRVAGRSSVGSSVLACNWCSRALPSIPRRWAAAQARARLQATASSAPVVLAPRIGASAVAAQVIACSAATLAPIKGCCLLRNTLQVFDPQRGFQVACGAATSCMPSLLARCESWRSTRCRYRSS